MSDIFAWIATHPIHMAMFIGIETIVVWTFVIWYGRKKIMS